MRKNLKAVFVHLADEPQPREHHVVPRMVSEDVLENGRIVRQMVVKPFDYGVPFTPQTGLDTKIGDLTFMSRNNITVEHTTFYLTNLGRNPFAIQQMQERFGKSLGDIKKFYNIKDLDNETR